VTLNVPSKIKDGGIQQPFRPQLPSDIDRPTVVKLMMECWEENPFKRPTFRTLHRFFVEQNVENMKTTEIELCQI
jgi:hypothetical protein